MTTIQTLADKAMLAKLTRRMMRTSMRDLDLEKTVREAAEDSSLTVSKSIFIDKSHPVRQVLSMLGDVYAEHVRRTAPWVDKGPRILPSSQFFTYSKALNDLIAPINALVPRIVAQWDDLVARDLAQRGSRGMLSDYPTADEVAERLSVDYMVYPLPDVRDFRVDIDPDMQSKLDVMVREAEDRVRREAITRMVVPLQRAAEKFAVPIGEKGSVFRDSMLENLRDGLEEAKALNISGDPKLTAAIETAEKLLSTKAFAEPDHIREHQVVRDAAKAKIDQILSGFAGL